MQDIAFIDGDLVVYPAHGVGVVECIEKQIVAGAEISLLVISFEKDKMIIRLPVNALLNSKIRKLCSKDDMASAIEQLKTPTKTKKMMWSRRAQEYSAKINTGDPTVIAQVVRDLYRSSNQPEHSYSERQIYQEALDRLVREYAAVEQIDIQEATKFLEEILNVA